MPTMDREINKKKKKQKNVTWKSVAFFFVEYKLWRGAVYGRAVIQNGITVLLIQ